MSELVECPKCGWVHMAVSEDYVRDWEERWKQYCKDWTEASLANYGITNRQPPTRELYESCFRCGNKETKDFFETKKRLNGQTIQPILWEKK